MKNLLFPIIQSASQTISHWPVENFLLGGILATTALNLTLNWRQARPAKEDILTMEDVIEDEPEIEPLPREEISGFTWHIDGASRTGKVRTENQDAFEFYQTNAAEALLVVCDGAGGVEGGKEAAQTAVKVIVEDIEETANGKLDNQERLLNAITAAQNVFAENKLSGITTAILALVQDDRLTYATLGDGALALIWPDGMVSQILTPHHILGQPDNIIAAYIGAKCTTPPRTGTIRIEPGSTLLLMSDGASDLFPYADFAENRSTYSAPLAHSGDSNLADHFLAQLEAARDPDTNAYLHHDNMTLLIAHLTQNGEA